jgi:flagellar motor switch protein FliM
LADRSESAVYKKELRHPISIGDWTTFKPSRSSSRKAKPALYGMGRLTKDVLETTLNIHHFFSLEFAKYLKESLKASIDIYSISVEQITYLDFLKSVTGGLIYNKLNMGDTGEIIFLVDYQLANMAINFSLGSQSIETKIKELTELEESIFQTIFNNMLDSFTKCWGNIFPKPSLEIISYPNIQRETHINLNEVITVISTHVSIANSIPAEFTFIYQGTTLKKLFESWQNKHDKAPLNFSKLSDALLNNIKIPVRAELGTTRLSTYEIASIENDDLISLDQKLSDPTDLILGGTTQLRSQPGIKDNRVGIRILSSAAKRVRNMPVLIQEDLSGTGTLEEENVLQEEGHENNVEAGEKEGYNPDVFEEETDNPNLGGR